MPDPKFPLSVEVQELPGAIGLSWVTPKRNYLHTIHVEAEGGDFTLEFVTPEGFQESGAAFTTAAGTSDTTDPIPYDADYHQVRDALQALDNIEPADVLVEDGRFPGVVAVEMFGQYKGIDVPTFIIDPTGLTEPITATCRGPSNDKVPPSPGISHFEVEIWTGDYDTGVLVFQDVKVVTENVVHYTEDTDITYFLRVRSVSVDGKLSDWYTAQGSAKSVPGDVVEPIVVFENPKQKIGRTLTFSPDVGLLVKEAPTGEFVANDGFSRDDSIESLGVAESSHIWQKLSDATWGIDTGKAYVEDSAANSRPSQYIEILISDMYEVESDITLSSTTNRVTAGLHFRAIDKDNYLYASLVNNSTNERVELRKVDVDVDSVVLASTNMTLTEGSTYNLRVSVQADVVKVYVDDVLKITHTLSAADYNKYGEATKVGLRGRWDTDNDDGGSQWDNFKVLTVVENPEQVLVNIPAKTAEYPTFMGLLHAKTLEVEGPSTFQSDENVMAENSKLVLQAELTSPGLGPTLTVVWDQYALADSPSPIPSGFKRGVTYDTTANKFWAAVPSEGKVVSFTFDGSSAPVLVDEFLVGGTPVGVGATHDTSNRLWVVYKDSGGVGVLQQYDLTTFEEEGVTFHPGDVDTGFTTTDSDIYISQVIRANQPNPGAIKVRILPDDFSADSEVETEYVLADTERLWDMEVYDSKWWFLIEDTQSGSRRVIATDTTGVVDESLEFPVPVGRAFVRDTDLNRFLSVASIQMTKHTEFVGGPKVFARYSWALGAEDAGGSAETEVSPSSSITFPDRAKLLVGIPPVPTGSGADRARVYTFVGSADDPAPWSNYDNQGDIIDPASSLLLESLNLSGGAPDVTAFGTGTPARIESELGGMYIDGAGVIQPAQESGGLSSGTDIGELRVDFDRARLAYFTGGGSAWAYQGYLGAHVALGADTADIATGIGSTTQITGLSLVTNGYSHDDFWDDANDSFVLPSLELAGIYRLVCHVRWRPENNAADTQRRVVIRLNGVTYVEHEQQAPQSTTRPTLQHVDTEIEMTSLSDDIAVRVSHNAGVNTKVEGDGTRSETHFSWTYIGPRSPA